jgi:hypothetical protein
MEPERRDLQQLGPVGVGKTCGETRRARLAPMKKLEQQLLRRTH